MALIELLDIGGEGRHLVAWNLNPRSVKTLGLSRGKPIPRLILARAEAIPLPARSVNVVLVERSPLKAEALHEIKRIVVQGGTIILRHALPPRSDPHRTACELLKGRIRQRKILVATHALQETVIQYHTSRQAKISCR